MANRFISCFFLLLMLIKVCIMPLIYIDFELRRDYIAKNLCVNRDKPELKCDGKCYLAKRLAMAHEKEQQEAERNFIFQLCETLADPTRPDLSFIPEIYHVNFSGVQETPYLPHLTGRMAIADIFRPPVA